MFSLLITFALHASFSVIPASLIVIPAKAGIYIYDEGLMDSRVRGNDRQKKSRNLLLEITGNVFNWNYWLV